MSKFFVGQRVRIVSCRNSIMQFMVGQEGVIEQESTVNPKNWLVSGARNVKDGRPCSWHQDRLEPILPEGAAPSVYTFHELMDSLHGAKA